MEQVLYNVKQYVLEKKKFVLLCGMFLLAVLVIVLISVFGNTGGITAYADDQREQIPEISGRNFSLNIYTKGNNTIIYDFYFAEIMTDDQIESEKGWIGEFDGDFYDAFVFTDQFQEAYKPTLAAMRAVPYNIKNPKMIIRSYAYKSGGDALISEKTYE